MQGECPVCGAQINLPEDLEVSQIVNCPECQSKLIVEKIEEKKVILKEMPKIEEDWGQ